MNRERQQELNSVTSQLEGMDDFTDEEQWEACIDELRRLLILEEAACAKMEPHADQPKTAANYVKSQRAIQAMEDALEYLHGRDAGEAHDTLMKVSELSPPRVYGRFLTDAERAKEEDVWFTLEEPAPKPKRRKRRAS